MIARYKFIYYGLKMIVKAISSQELNLYKSWNSTFLKLKNLSNLDRYMTLFWLIGPFVYLIERDPADLWLTLIGIVFLIRCFIKKEWSWSKQTWFKLAIAFWLSSLASASLSPDPFYSLSQGIPWVRFPIYAAAAQVWLGKSRDTRLLMFISIIFGLLIMNGILLAEVLIDPKIRPTWPYGDTVPGVYIAKLGLPILCALFVLNLRKINFYTATFIIFSFIITLLTGERTHFILLTCSCFLSSIFWKPKIFNIFISVIIALSIITVTLFLRPDIYNRLVSQTSKILEYTFQVQSMEHFKNSSINKKKNREISQKSFDSYMFNFMSDEELNKYNSKSLPEEEFNLIIGKIDKFNQIGGITSYWGAWRGGIQQGLERPLLGIGPSGTRKTCKNLTKNNYEWLPGKNYCGNHPHNFYVQMFAETGTIGLFLGLLMIISLISTCFRARKNNLSCPMVSTAFIIPLGLFFPLQQFGSFFGQWGNLFIWFAVGFAISQVQNFNIKTDFEVNND